MLDLIQQLSDNQIAVIGCAGAVAAATLLLMVSFHINPKNRQDRVKQPSEVPFSQTEASHPNHRRAA